MKDLILSLTKAETLLTSRRSANYKSLVSIGDPNTPIPRGYDNFQGSKIRLEFKDSSSFVSSSHVNQLIDFFMVSEGPTIFHCQMGISRSAAACLIKIAMSQEGRGKLQAEKSIQELRAIKDGVYPNFRMIEFADEILGYGGSLSAQRKIAFDNWTPRQ